MNQRHLTWLWRVFLWVTQPLLLVQQLLIWYVTAPQLRDALYAILYLFTQMSVDEVMPGATVTVGTQASKKTKPQAGKGKGKGREPAPVSLVFFSEAFSLLMLFFYR